MSQKGKSSASASGGEAAPSSSGGAGAPLATPPDVTRTCFCHHAAYVQRGGGCWACFVDRHKEGGAEAVTQQAAKFTISPPMWKSLVGEKKSSTTFDVASGLNQSLSLVHCDECGDSLRVLRAAGKGAMYPESIRLGTNRYFKLVPGTSTYKAVEESDPNATPAEFKPLKRKKFVYEPPKDAQAHLKLNNLWLQPDLYRTVFKVRGRSSEAAWVPKSVAAAPVAPPNANEREAWVNFFDFNIKEFASVRKVEADLKASLSRSGLGKFLTTSGYQGDVEFLDSAAATWSVGEPFVGDAWKRLSEGWEALKTAILVVDELVRKWASLSVVLSEELFIAPEQGMLEFLRDVFEHDVEGEIATVCSHLRECAAELAICMEVSRLPPDEEKRKTFRKPFRSSSTVFPFTKMNPNTLTEEPAPELKDKDGNKVIGEQTKFSGAQQLINDAVSRVKKIRGSLESKALQRADVVLTFWGVGLLQLHVCKHVAHVEELLVRHTAGIFDVAVGAGKTTPPPWSLVKIARDPQTSRATTVHVTPGVQAALNSRRPNDPLELLRVGAFTGTSGLCGRYIHQYGKNVQDAMTTADGWCRANDNAGATLAIDTNLLLNNAFGNARKALRSFRTPLGQTPNTFAAADDLAKGVTEAYEKEVCTEVPRAGFCEKICSKHEENDNERLKSQICDFLRLPTSSPQAAQGPISSIQGAVEEAIKEIKPGDDSFLPNGGDFANRCLAEVIPITNPEFLACVRAEMLRGAPVNGRVGGSQPPVLCDALRDTITTPEHYNAVSTLVTGFWEGFLAATKYSAGLTSPRERAAVVALEISVWRMAVVAHLFFAARRSGMLGCGEEAAAIKRAHLLAARALQTEVGEYMLQAELMEDLDEDDEFGLGGAGGGKKKKKEAAKKKEKKEEKEPTPAAPAAPSGKKSQQPAPAAASVKDNKSGAAATAKEAAKPATKKETGEKAKKEEEVEEEEEEEELASKMVATSNKSAPAAKAKPGAEKKTTGTAPAPAPVAAKAAEQPKQAAASGAAPKPAAEEVKAKPQQPQPSSKQQQPSQAKSSTGTSPSTAAPAAKAKESSPAAAKETTTTTAKTSASAKGAKPSVWVCTLCEFENAAEATSCQVCSTPKPTGGDVSSTTPSTKTAPPSSAAKSAPHPAPVSTAQPPAKKEPVVGTHAVGGKMHEECPICMERAAHVLMMPCCHSMCKECIINLKVVKCPICQDPVDSFYDEFAKADFSLEGVGNASSSSSSS